MKHKQLLIFILALLAIAQALESENARKFRRHTRRYRRRRSIKKRTSLLGRCCTAKCVRRCLKSFSTRKCTKYCKKNRKTEKKGKKAKKYNKKGGKNQIAKKERKINKSKKIMKLRQLLVEYYPHYHPRFYYQFRPYWTHFHYHTHYPFYWYYWYFFPEYHYHYPYYYSYYYFYWPHVHYFWHHHHFFHGIILTNGKTVKAKDSDSTTKVVETLKPNKSKLKQCKNGPTLVFSTKSNGHLLRFFLGDVNDLINIECLYLMDAVVSVGKFAHIDNLVKIYKNPKRNSKKIIKKLSSPFKNPKFRPSKPKKTKINRNLSSLSFKIGTKKVSKSLLFLHLFNKDLKKGKLNVVGTLGKRLKVKTGNVLFIVDHLQKNSQVVLKRLLKKYGKFSAKKLKALKYRKRAVFNKN